MDYRIAQLDTNDSAYENGARWALMAPVWIGKDVEVRVVKTAGLQDAVKAAKAGKVPLVDIGACILMQSAPHGDPLTIERAEKWIEHIKERAAAGNKHAIHDLGIL